MPIIGPQGQKRPADTLANALHVAKLVTGEAEEEYVDQERRASGSKGGTARAEDMTDRSTAGDGPQKPLRHAG